MAKDPICGMEVDEKKARSKGLVLKNKFFCSKKCKSDFANKNNITSILLSVLLVAVAIIVSLTGFMIPFMGVVFLILAGLKLIDIKGFAQMFSQYDLVAKRSRTYSLIYPFIELSLGLMFIFKFQVKIAALITFFVMTIGAIGVGKNIFSKNKIKCACLGAKIKVPLTGFTLTEDIVMAIMGLMILFL